jgi:hypothetical protein
VTPSTEAELNSTEEHTPGKFPYYWLGKSGTLEMAAKSRKAGTTRRTRIAEGKITRAGSSKVWTVEEIAVLRDAFWDRPKEELLRLLPGRTWKSILGAGFYRGMRRRNHAPVDAHFSEAEKGYLAGLIEGDGTVGIFRSGTKYWAPCVYVIANTNKALTDHVHDLMLRAGFKAFKSTGHEQSQHAKGRRYMWTVSIHGISPCRAFLDQIVPFLVGKRGQAEAVLRFCRSRQDTWASTGNRTPYSEEQLAAVTEVKRLNRRGILE